MNRYPLAPLNFSQTANGTDTVGGEFTLVSGSNASVPLAFNASAAEVAEAVNGMKDWEGVVLVDRQEVVLSESSDSDDKHEGDMFEWRLTFSPIEGDVKELRVGSIDFVAPTNIQRVDLQLEQRREYLVFIQAGVAGFEVDPPQMMHSRFLYTAPVRVSPLNIAILSLCCTRYN